MAPRKVIRVDAESMPSTVHIGTDILEDIPAELCDPANGIKASKYVLVSDTNVWALYGTRITRAFHAAGYLAPPPPGALSSQPGGFGLGSACGCGDDSCDNLSGDGYRQLLCFQVAPGEASKSREGKAAIEDFMFGARCNRDTWCVRASQSHDDDTMMHCSHSAVQRAPVAVELTMPCVRPVLSPLAAC
jgi:3-dehydroquinate synthetase